MKKIITILGTLGAVLTLVACHHAEQSTPASQPATKQGQVASKAKRAATSSASATSTPAAPKRSSDFWSTKQDTELKQFMQQWQQQMGQRFTGTYAAASVNYLGFIYPQRLDRTVTEHVFDQSQTMGWLRRVNHRGRFQVVAAAVGGKPRATYPMLYLFAIDTKDQTPIVLISQTTNGGHLYFYETQNAALRAGFAKIAIKAAQDEGQAEHVSPVSNWHWTKASALAYLRRLDSRNAAVQAAAVAVTENGVLANGNWTFYDAGRTGQLISAKGSGPYWSLTKNSDGTTTCLLCDTGEEQPPNVQFEVTDATHLIRAGLHNGKPIVSRNR